MHSPIPYALGLHTTTPELGLSLNHPETGVIYQTWDLGRDMSTQLHECLFSFIRVEDLQHLDCIAVACGPGGFTSTRLGVVTARTLAQQLNIPLFGISSLAAYAWFTVQHTHQVTEPYTHQQTPQSETLIAVHMPARREQVFGAVYGIQWDDAPTVDSGRLSSEDHPSVGSPEPSPLAAKRKPKGLVCHKSDHVIDANEWHTYLQTEYSEPMATVEITGELGYTASSLVDLATIEYRNQHRPHWATVQPFYGQSPV